MLLPRVPPSWSARSAYPERVVINQALTLRGVQSGALGAAAVVAPPGGIVQNTASLATGNPIPCPCYFRTAGGLRKRNIGSPNRMYVRRVSGSLIFDLAFLIASPRVNEGSVNSSLTRF